MRNVLILGAGLVSRPIVRQFLDHGQTRLIIGSIEHSEAELLIDGHANGNARQIDVSDAEQLEPLIREANLVVSLVPYAFHVQIARLAIRHRKNMITASYVSQEMRELDAEARQAGVTILNEIGLDHYIMKPWDPPEERLYPVLDDLLSDWLASVQVPYDGIRVAGTLWSASSHNVKDFLARSQIPYQWLDIERDEEAKTLVESSSAGRPQ